MAWEKRHNRKYYYRSKKINGQVVKEYIGAGPVAEVCARMDKQERQLRELKRQEEEEALQADKELLDGIETALISLYDTIESHMTQAYMDAGYHKHRGQWRKQVSNKDKYPDAVALMKRAQDGDKEAYGKIAEIMDKNPDLDRQLREAHDLAGMAQKSIIEGFYKDNLLARHSIGQQVEELKLTIAGPNPSPLESLLVDRIVCCWMQVNGIENNIARNLTKWSIKQARFWDQRLSSAHKRHLSSIKALADIRRKQLPTLQVNVAGRQEIHSGR